MGLGFEGLVPNFGQLGKEAEGSWTGEPLLDLSISGEGLFAAPGVER